MNSKEDFAQRLIDWFGEPAASWDDLSREIYAAGLTPEKVFKEAKKPPTKEEKQQQEILNQAINFLYADLQENIRSQKEG